MKRNRYIGYFLLALTCLLTACSSGSDDPSDPPVSPVPTDEKEEIKLNATAWNFMEGMRATTFDNATSLQTEGSFTCGVYTENTTTAYISPTTVNWENDKWEWSDGKHYWPATGNLDFFAYMPATTPEYITGPTYTADHNVAFTCTNLVMTTATEFIYAVKTGQNKANQGTTGVTLNFQHPFARINMQWANYDHSAITSYSIKFKNIKNNGSYSEAASPQWTTTGDNTDLTVTSLDVNGAASPTYYLVIPQSWAGEIEVNASWNDWGDTSVEHTLTTTVPTDWEPGYSYTYTFTISPDDLIVNISKFTEQW